MSPACKQEANLPTRLLLNLAKEGSNNFFPFIHSPAWNLNRHLWITTMCENQQFVLLFPSPKDVGCCFHNHHLKLSQEKDRAQPPKEQAHSPQETGSNDSICRISQMRLIWGFQTTSNKGAIMGARFAPMIAWPNSLGWHKSQLSPAAIVKIWEPSMRCKLG